MCTCAKINLRWEYVFINDKLITLIGLSSVNVSLPAVSSLLRLVSRKCSFSSWDCRLRVPTVNHMHA